MRKWPSMGGGSSAFRSLPRFDGREIVQNWDALTKYCLSPFSPSQQCHWSGAPFPDQLGNFLIAVQAASPQRCALVPFVPSFPLSFGCKELDGSQKDGRRYGHIMAGFNWCFQCPEAASRDSTQNTALYLVITSSPSIRHPTDLAYRKELDPVERA